MRFDNRVLIRGGGDLATGVALRLHRAGIKILITELAQPLAVRRAVSFSEAVYEGIHTVEGVRARLIEANQLEGWDEADDIPVIVDPELEILKTRRLPVVIDARLLKTEPKPLPFDVPLHIGLGPGFAAGQNCRAAIETQRGHTLGRVYWNGTTQPDSGKPDGDPRRVLRAPADGVLKSIKRIGDHCEADETVAIVENQFPILSPFRGVLRGMIRDGLRVTTGLKVGDVDARDDHDSCFIVSDKALAIGGGALEAALTLPEIRQKLFST